MQKLQNELDFCNKVWYKSQKPPWWWVYYNE